MKIPNRKNINYAIYITTTLIIVFSMLLTYVVVNGNKKQTIEVEGQKTYVLSNSATDYQKTVFDELDEMLKKADKTDYDVVALIVKNYIADFYTWTNKQGSHDVGGLQFVFGPSTLYIQQEAKALFYKDVSYYMETYGAENLLEVENVNIKYADPEADFIYKDQRYTSYYVAAEWTYKPSSAIDVSEYQKKGYFSVLYRDGKFEIYRYFME